MNGLLLCRIYRRDTRGISKQLLDAAIDLDPFSVWKRPGLDEFLQDVLGNFTVAIWTSANARNAHKMVDAIMSPETKAQLLFVWSQEDCTVVERTEWKDGERPTKKQKRRFLKRLASVWEAFPQFGADDTLLIDDSEEKSVENPPGLLYCPKTWTVLDEQCMDDTFLTKECVDKLDALAHSDGTVAQFTARQ